MQARLPFQDQEVTHLPFHRTRDVHRVSWFTKRGGSDLAINTGLELAFPECGVIPGSCGQLSNLVRPCVKIEN